MRRHQISSSSTEQVSFIVQRFTIGFHIIEPYIIGSAAIGFGKDHDSSAYPCIGFKNPTWHRDHRLQLMVVYNLLTNAFVGITTAKKHTIGNNNRSAATGFNWRSIKARKSNSVLDVFVIFFRLGEMVSLSIFPFKRRIR